MVTHIARPGVAYKGPALWQGRRSGRGGLLHVDPGPILQPPARPQCLAKALPVHLPERGIEENQIERRAPALEENGRILAAASPCRRAQGVEMDLDRPDEHWLTVHKHHFTRPARQGFQPQGAAARIEIETASTTDPGLEPVEKGLTDPVAGGTHALQGGK